MLLRLWLVPGWCLVLIFSVCMVAESVFTAPYAACCDCARKETNLPLRVIRLSYFVSTFMVKGLSSKKAALTYLSEVAI